METIEHQKYKRKNKGMQDYTWVSFLNQYAEIAQLSLGFAIPVSTNYKKNKIVHKLEFKSYNRSQNGVDRVRKCILQLMDHCSKRNKGAKTR